MTTNSGQTEHPEIAAALTAMGLLKTGEAFSVTSLSGGVSCDVWRVDAAGRAPVVVKRALPRLRVAAEWLAPVERAASEVAWIRLDGSVERVKITELLMTEALERKPAEQAGPGDIIAIAGIPDIMIGETLADADDPRPLPLITVDEPAISMTIGTNTSPLVGRVKGAKVTARMVKDRL